MDIKHTLAQGCLCLGLNKKVRMFLHGSYPIMAYYNPIILDNIPIKPLYSSDKVLLVRVRDGQFLERLKFFPIVKDLNCEKFLYRTSLSLVYYLVIYIISQADIMSYFSGM
jgi:hypothetical protein